MAGERRLTGTEKVAVLLLSVQQEAAQEMMKALPPNLIQRIANYAAMLRDVPTEKILAIKEEFCATMQHANPLQLGNTHETFRDLLSGFMSPEAVDKLTRNLDSETDSHEGLEALKWMAPDSIASFLRKEHPQTMALVLAHLEPSQAAQVLAALKPADQAEVILRLSTLERVSPRVLQDLNNVLKEELIAAASTSMESLGGIGSAAEIMNNVDKATETSIFEAIEEINPDLVEEIRERMFTFEDLITLDNRGMQDLAKQISNDQLQLALKSASDEIKAKFFSNISSRAADMIREELEVMGPVKLSDVEKAQQEIVKVARRLDEEGKIQLGNKGFGDAYV